jgi:hypothetical protein
MLGNMWGVHLPGTCTDSKRALCERCVSLCGTSVRGTCREGSVTWKFESCITHVKEGLKMERLSLFIQAS